MRQVQVEVLFRDGKAQEIRYDYRLDGLDIDAIKHEPIEQWFLPTERDYEQWRGLEEEVKAEVDDPEAEYAYAFHGPADETARFECCVRKYTKDKKTGTWLPGEEVAKLYIRKADTAWAEDEAERAFKGYGIAAEEYHSAQAMHWLADQNERQYRECLRQAQEFRDKGTGASAPEERQEYQAEAARLVSAAKQYLAGAVRYWEMEAGNGSAEVQLRLGERFQKGEDVTADPERAAKWYGIAAENGNAEAQFRMGNACMEGSGVAKDAAAAADWYRKAAEQGHKLAQLQYAECCINGKGRAVSRDEAVKWYKKAAEQGVPEAQLKYAKCIEQDQSSRSTTVPQQAPERGQAAAQPGNAAHTGQAQNDKRPIAWYQQAAEQGSLEAQVHLAECYDAGNNVEKSLEQAAYWYKQAASNPEGRTSDKRKLRIRAQREYARRCSLGLGVPRNSTEATRYYRDAASDGDAEAQFGYAECLAQDTERARWYLEAAKQGHVRAMNALAYCYMYGKGFPHNLELAAKWYKRAAEGGLAEAQYTMSELCRTGRGVPKDAAAAAEWHKKASEQSAPEAQAKDEKPIEGQSSRSTTVPPQAPERGQAAAQPGDAAHTVQSQNSQKAIVWYQQAAEQGSLEAQVHLAECYDAGDDVKRSPEQAAYWYKQAASNPEGRMSDKKALCIRAQKEYARRCRLGLGVPRSITEAARYYRDAASDGDAEAQFGYAECLTQDTERAKWYLEAAKQGHVRAMNALAYCYMYGKGFTQNTGLAAMWYRKAAESGLAEAQYIMGGLYRTGSGVTKDAAAAAEWYGKAAAQHYATAQYQLGCCCEEGTGTPVDYVKAAQLFYEAAGKGIKDAQYRYGRCCELGRGVKPDLQEAAKWYTKAADGILDGCAAAEYALGTWYLNGNSVVAKNETKAMPLFRSAARRGYAEAQLACGIYDENRSDSESAERYYSDVLTNSSAPRKVEAEANYRMGCLYEKQKKDRNGAMVYYSRAASQDHAEAAYRLAMCHKEMPDFDRDDSRKKMAAHWFEKAAGLGHPEAEYWYGWCLFGGIGVPKNVQEGYRWYYRAAEQGVAAAMNSVGYCNEQGYVVQKDPAEAVVWYRKAAGKDHERGLYHLGFCYADGIGVKKDDARAMDCFKRFEKVSASGDAEVEYRLGCFCRDGVGGAKEPIHSFAWLEKAAKKGHAQAQFELAACYWSGTGTKADKSKAQSWLNLAVAQGNTDAMMLMACAYLGAVDLGIKQDLKKGGKLICELADEEAECISMEMTKAGVQELAMALCAIGLGVRRDMKKAQKYADRAAALGSQTAQKEMDEWRKEMDTPAMKLLTTVGSPFFKNYIAKMFRGEVKK